VNGDLAEDDITYQQLQKICRKKFVA